MRFFAIAFWSASLAAQQLALQPIVTGLNRPVGVVSAGDSRLFIVQQLGRILIYDGTGVLPTAFLDVSSLVSPGISGESERGLLGLAFDPRYASNGFFFIYYTDRDGNITLARYTRSAASPDRADPNSAAIVLTIDHTEFSNHNGGQLQFGPDGYLYLGPGDGGGAGDPHNHAQDRSQLLGKLLRIDVSTLPYRIPPSNPFVSTAGARPEIWAYGLRNPWRFSFDRNTGDLFIADVGQNLWEEVDFQPSTSIGGENYGWRRMEGTHCYNPSTNCQDPSFTMPILEYGHVNGQCSITGGYRYHGAKYPRMHDIYFYGDYCSGTIWGATQQINGTWTSKTLLSTRLAIASFGEDANGELYVVDLNGTVSQIIDLAAPPSRRRAVQYGSPAMSACRALPPRSDEKEDAAGEGDQKRRQGLVEGNSKRKDDQQEKRVAAKLLHTANVGRAALFAIRRRPRRLFVARPDRLGVIHAVNSV